jgi:predicted neuraminidase
MPAIDALVASHPSPDSSVQVLSRSVVFAHPSEDPYDPQNRYGFNHAPSVVLLPDGRLLAAWFSGPFEASVNQLILTSASSDNGTTWSPAQSFQDFPRKSDFDPAFIADGQRTWFFFSAGRWNRYPTVRDEAEEVGPNSFSTYARFSDDSGKSWSSPVAVSPHHGSRTNGIKLSTGELLLPMENFIERDASVLKSVDGGRSWNLQGHINTPAGADEPTIVELSTGAVLMILRTRDGVLWKSVSSDKGDTWEPPEKTEMIGAATSSNLFRLKDGRLVLTHNESPHYRTPLTIRLSGDDGATWRSPFELDAINIPSVDDPEWSKQVTYPSVAQLEDGSLLIVWARLVLSDRKQYGDIISARVRV